MSYFRVETFVVVVALLNSGKKLHGEKLSYLL